MIPEFFMFVLGIGIFTFIVWSLKKFLEGKWGV